MLLKLLSSLLLLATTRAARVRRESDCVGTINSMDDVADAVRCTTVVLTSFTVPAGQTLDINLLDGSTVNMNGDIHFRNQTWAGPLFQVSGDSITFNGNGHTFDGGGPFYWDGLGGNGGVTKPAPMMKIRISGTFSNVKVLNSPARTYSISNPGPLVIDGLTIDNSLGDLPYSKSNGKAAGHNTDGFDASTEDLTIQNSVIMNQVRYQPASGGFTTLSLTAKPKTTALPSTEVPTSSSEETPAQEDTKFPWYGSINSDVTVNGITISGNRIINNDQALRIKTIVDATNSRVTNITYSGNTATGIRRFGIIIDQSYPSTIATPGNGVQISAVNFVPPQTSIEVNDNAQRVAVNCGVGSCVGNWDWSNLDVSGGVVGDITNFDGIIGFDEEEKQRRL